MNKNAPDLDAYIAEAPAFARPILVKLRRAFRKACPDIEETMKWACPHFEYKGIVAGMAAFKNYVTFGFRKWSLMKDSHDLFAGADASGMGFKLTDVDDLPPERTLIAYMREAVALNEQGVKLPARKKKPKKKLVVPDYFREALSRKPGALAAFEAFSPSHQREYVEWITEAKQEATRARRLATALEWIAEGKPRNWKYM